MDPKVPRIDRFDCTKKYTHQVNARVIEVEFMSVLKDVTCMSCVCTYHRRCACWRCGCCGSGCG